MKSIFAVLALVASAYAQGIRIAAPAENSHLVATKNVLVDVERPVRPRSSLYSHHNTYDSRLQNGHTPSTDVAVIIGLRSCAPSGDCDAIADSGTLGTILYKGTYDPILRTGGGSMYQNFTVAVPDTVGAGSALLSVAHLYAGGVSAAPFWVPRDALLMTFTLRSRIRPS